MNYFCKHDWGKWSRALPNYNGNVTQVKECLKCGKIKTRVVNISQLNGNAAVLINTLLETIADELTRTTNNK